MSARDPITDPSPWPRMDSSPLTSALPAVASSGQPPAPRGRSVLASDPLQGGDKDWLFQGLGGTRWLPRTMGLRKNPLPGLPLGSGFSGGRALWAAWGRCSDWVMSPAHPEQVRLVWAPPSQPLGQQGAAVWSGRAGLAHWFLCPSAGPFLPCMHTAAHRGQVQHAPTGLPPRCRAG